MRKIWIDTDCCCDDAMAIIMALYHPEVEVAGISVVTGYRPASQVWRNPFLICAEAQRPAPPVYCGGDETVAPRVEMPEVHVHGEDGMGDLGLPMPADAKLESGHAALGILKAIAEAPGELEIVTLGPLTNLALAFRLDPTAAQRIKRLWIMGGTGRQTGNLSAILEANVGGDPEAAQIVFTAGAPFVLIPYDPAEGEARYTREEMQALAAAGRAGRFIFNANHDLLDILPEGGSLFEVDPAAMAVVLWPDLVREENAARCEVECRGTLSYGMVVEDTTCPERFNCRVVHRIDARAFKARTLELFRRSGSGKDEE